MILPPKTVQTKMKILDKDDTSNMVSKRQWDVKVRKLRTEKKFPLQTEWGAFLFIGLCDIIIVKCCFSSPLMSLQECHNFLTLRGTSQLLLPFNRKKWRSTLLLRTDHILQRSGKWQLLCAGLQWIECCSVKDVCCLCALKKKLSEAVFLISFLKKTLNFGILTSQMLGGKKDITWKEECVSEQRKQWRDQRGHKCR